MQKAYQNIEKFLNKKTWFIAFSGGLDSVCLLHFLASLVNRPQLIAIHINHNLQTDATKFAEFCQDFCSKLNIDLICQEVHLKNKSEKEARDARYQVFNEIVGDDCVLFLAHHLNDNIETVLQRLFRGTGLEGLCGISQTRFLNKQTNALLHRPFLHLSKNQLKQYLYANNLNFIEDKTNLQSLYIRNYIRNKIFPQILEKFPQIEKIFSQNIEIFNKQHQLMQEIAEADFANIKAVNFSYLVLDYAKFMQLSKLRQENLIIYFLKLFNELTPQSKHFISFYEFLKAKDFSFASFQLKNGSLRRDKRFIYYLAKSQIQKIKQQQEAKNGLNIFNQQEIFIENLEQEAFLRYKQNGDRFYFATNNKIYSQKLKQVFQNLNIPEFLRDEVVFLVDNNNQILAFCFQDIILKTPFASNSLKIYSILL